MGLTYFYYQTFPWSTQLFCIGIVILIVGRGCGTLGLYYLLRSCGYEKGHEAPLNLKELVFIWYAGMIRGAIAFGLVLRVDGFFPNREVIVTTCLALVVCTTIFCGSTIGLLGKCLFREAEIDDFTSAREELRHTITTPLFDVDKSAEGSLRSSLAVKKKGFKWAGSRCRRFEAAIFRDFFIYKHSVDRRS